MIAKFMPFIVAIFFLFMGSCSIKNQPLPVTRLDPYWASEMKKHRGYWLEVQIAQRRLILAKGGHIIKVFPIAVGMPNYPTPTGSRKISKIIWNPWWYPPKTSEWVEDPTPVKPRTSKNPLGEIKMPLGDSYLIHGTKEVRSINRWAPHGCIRMLFEDIFSLVQLLMGEYSEYSAVEQMEKANRDPRTEFSTPLNREIPVVLTYQPVKVHDGYVTISPDFYHVYPNHAAHAATVIQPYLKTRKVSEKRIQELFKTFRGQNVHVPLESVSW